jgi:hypothetical protein
MGVRFSSFASLWISASSSGVSKSPLVPMSPRSVSASFPDLSARWVDQSASGDRHRVPEGKESAARASQGRSLRFSDSERALLARKAFGNIDARDLPDSTVLPL